MLVSLVETGVLLLLCPHAVRRTRDTRTKTPTIACFVVRIYLSPSNHLFEKHDSIHDTGIAAMPKVSAVNGTKTIWIRLREHFTLRL